MNFLNLHHGLSLFANATCCSIFNIREIWKQIRGNFAPRFSKNSKFINIARPNIANPKASSSERFRSTKRF